MRKRMVRERVLVKDSDIDLESLRRAAEIRNGRDSDPDRLRERMIRGSHFLRIAQARSPESREELMKFALEASQEEAAAREP